MNTTVFYPGDIELPGLVSNKTQHIGAVVEWVTERGEELLGSKRMSKAAKAFAHAMWLQQFCAMPDDKVAERVSAGLAQACGARRAPTIVLSNRVEQ